MAIVEAMTSGVAVLSTDGAYAPSELRDGMVWLMEESRHCRHARAVRAGGPAPKIPLMVSSLGIVLPAYNEEARLGPALDELFGYLCAVPEGALPASVSVLVVDDGSTDGTVALVKARPEFVAGAVATDTLIRSDCPTLRLLTVPHGGKGSAVRAGMLAAEGDVLVFADADMATPPDMLPRLVAALADADVALGSRIQPDGAATG